MTDRYRRFGLRLAGVSTATTLTSALVIQALDNARTYRDAGAPESGMITVAMALFVSAFCVPPFLLMTVLPKKIVITPRRYWSILAAVAATFVAFVVIWGLMERS